MSDWPHVPNWSAGYNVTRQYRTEIITSRGGQEQRIAWMNTPRKTYEFQVREFGEALADVDSLLQTRQHYQIVIPDSVRKTYTVAATAAGVSSVQVTTVPRWLLVGTVVVLGDRAQRETVTVQGIVGTTVTFSTALTLAHKAQARLYFGVTGRFDPNLTSTRVTDRAADLALSFDQTPLSEPYVLPGVAAVTFNQREVFLTKPNWASAINLTFDHQTEKVDYGHGAIATYAPILFGTRTLQATYTKLRSAQITDIEDTFDRMRGQQGEFYMPTWQDDLPLALDIASGATSFRVAGRRIFDRYAGTTVYLAICIVKTDGTFVFKLVSAITLNSGNTFIGVTDPFAADLPRSSVKMVCWMPVCRFASDIMKTEWVTDLTAQTQLSIQSLQALTPEV